jgi:hypothetical protein
MLLLQELLQCHRHQFHQFLNHFRHHHPHRLLMILKLLMQFHYHQHEELLHPQHQHLLHRLQSIQFLQV